MEFPRGNWPVVNATRGPVAVVNDDYAFQRFMATALGLEGYDSVVLRSGAAARTYLQTHRAVCAIVDYILPDIDGLALIEALRADPATHRLPILLCCPAAFIQSPDLVARIQRTRACLLAKPVSTEQLNHAIRQMLAPIQVI